jgi:hypothetical protein
MITAIVYGRNDSHGYNLHRRAALSLNCAAELLSAPTSEILFVDYNSPEDFPTFPEAISDTLTTVAKRKLRVLRVRSHVHARFQDRTRSPVIESVARNVALRRSRPENRWILSTNTDLVFAPLRRESLDDIASGLVDGFYHTPRIEVPEAVWETLDRMQPRRAIEDVRTAAKRLFLNEVVLSSSPFVFDACGDFQLMRRSDLWAMGGFDESMLLGWHVDANIAKRLSLRFGDAGDLSDEVLAYHCDHTRQSTHLHGRSRTVEDWGRFVEQVERPDLPAQQGRWGCPDDDIEEISLLRGNTVGYVTALAAVIGAEQVGLAPVEYSSRTYDRTDYDPRHVLPFLLDLFASANRKTELAWVGGKPELLRLFAEAWESLGFSGRLRAIMPDPCGASQDGGTVQDLPDVVEQAGAFVLDFGSEDPHGKGPAGLPRADMLRLGQAFLAIVRDELRRREAGLPARRIALVGTINTFFEGALFDHLAGSYGPFSTRLRHGFVAPPGTASRSLRSRVEPRFAGLEENGRLVASGVVAGEVFRLTLPHLLPSDYRLEIVLKDVEVPAGTEAAAVLDLTLDSRPVGGCVIPAPVLMAGRITTSFSLDDAASIRIDTAVTASLRTLGLVHFVLEDVILTPGAAAAAVRQYWPPRDWLPFLLVGGSGRRKNGLVSARPGSGTIVYGPYWAIPSGSYCATLEFSQRTPEQECVEPSCELDVVVAGVVGQRRAIRADDDNAERRSLMFHIPSDPAGDGCVIEIRVWPRSGRDLTLTKLVVEPLDGAAGARASGIDILGEMTLGRAGRWQAGGVQSVLDSRGAAGSEVENRLVLSGVSQVLAPGAYEAHVTVEAEPHGLLERLLRLGARFFRRERAVLGRLDVSVRGYGATVSTPLVAHGDSHCANRVNFTIPPRTGEDAGAISLRVVAAARARFKIRSLLVRRRAP